MNLRKSKRKKLFILLIVLILIAVLVLIDWFIQTGENKLNAYKTSHVLMNQIRDTISKNEQEEKTLKESLKEDCITRARAVSYIIDHNPNVVDQLPELMKIANLLSVDEIHLFDENGKIYNGTNPQYYGYNFNSGEQMAFFKPMLDDKTKVMCQDVTPNTAESKSMMYAICWNDEGTHMVQVGIEPLRLLQELHVNEVSEVINKMIVEEGTDLIVADKDTMSIRGTTKNDLRRKHLSEIGITENCDGDMINFETVVNGKKALCTMSDMDKYRIVIIQNLSVVNRNIPMALAIVVAYLLIATVIMTEIVRRLNKDVEKEHTVACTDELTGLYNRREYENMISEYSLILNELDFVYAAIDINGLKMVNDTMGHSFGDILIKGASDCLKKCFAHYGKIYRIGGDEFAVIVLLDMSKFDDILLQFEDQISLWSKQNDMELSVALGYVRTEEYPQKDIRELAKIADARMYQEKERYYRETGHDRRR